MSSSQVDLFFTLSLSVALWSHRCPSLLAVFVARKAAIGCNKVWFLVSTFEKMRTVVAKLFKQRRCNLSG